MLGLLIFGWGVWWEGESADRISVIVKVTMLEKSKVGFTVRASTKGGGVGSPAWSPLVSWSCRW